MILPFKGKWPEIHETAFIAPSCDLVGDVTIGAHSSVWFQCVVRGDVNAIRIGARTNVQDHSMLHVTRKKAALVIGDDVTIGHRVTLHGCTIQNRVLVGMGAVLLDHCEIGEDSIVGAGALVTKGKKFPPRSLIMGTPARVERELTPDEIAHLIESAGNYVNNGAEYKAFVRGPERMGQTNHDLEDFEDLELEGEEK